MGDTEVTPCFKAATGWCVNCRHNVVFDVFGGSHCCRECGTKKTVKEVTIYCQKCAAETPLVTEGFLHYCGICGIFKDGPLVFASYIPTPAPLEAGARACRPFYCRVCKTTQVCSRADTEQDTCISCGEFATLAPAPPKEQLTSIYTCPMCAAAGRPHTNHTEIKGVPAGNAVEIYCRVCGHTETQFGQSLRAKKEDITMDMPHFENIIEAHLRDERTKRDLIEARMKSLEGKLDRIAQRAEDRLNEICEQFTFLRAELAEKLVRASAPPIIPDTIDPMIEVWRVAPRMEDPDGDIIFQHLEEAKKHAADLVEDMFDDLDEDDEGPREITLTKSHMLRSVYDSLENRWEEMV